jgi:energy-coupling factor transport system ATP-binding protein
LVSFLQSSVISISQEIRNFYWLGGILLKDILSVKDLSFSYHQSSTPALHNISFSVYENEWLAICGHNGSGKSTLAKLLNGLLLPKEGYIKLGSDLKLSEETIWHFREKAGMVFQNPDNQFVGTTVKDDVAFGLENRGIPREEMEQRIEDSLRAVNMIDFLDQEPHHLSGGQKQRIAIAGILAVQPKIIILDEATSMLDPKGREEVTETMKELMKNHNVTIISITHEIEEMVNADRMIVLSKGELYAEGTPYSVFQRGEELKKVGLDLPFSVKISSHLINRGFPLPKVYLSKEELVDALWSLNLKM